MNLPQPAHGLGLRDPAGQALRHRLQRRDRLLRWTLMGGATLAAFHAWRERAAALAGRRHRFEAAPVSPVDAASSAITRAKTMTGATRPREKVR